jgi:UDP-N-acetylmuramoyl-L-alanyl-D-glutamate--2,6-diaminopimelate ligase
LQLSTLLTETSRLTGDGSVEIGGLVADSREVRRGDLFAALGGAHQDGRQFISQAVQRGAAAVLGPAGVAAEGLSVPVIEDADPRRALAQMAARFYRQQPEVVVAVTGTNGKTSTAVFARQLWARLGQSSASLGTLGLDSPAGHVAGSLTTPDPVSLHKLLAELADAGVTRLALEASSHGLDQRRLDGVQFRAAAFTHLSRDHFDYHGSEATYFAAKRRLFAELLPSGAFAVLNADVPQHDTLLAVARERRLEVIDYGRRARRLRLLEQGTHGEGQLLQLELDGWRTEVPLPLVGPFQAWNALAALGLLIAAGERPRESAEGLSRLVGAPGRMQLVARHPNGATAFVDYAHTPDSIEKALAALRVHTAGKLSIVFGCGGDRDPGKRPLMAKAAAGGADRAYLTDDNPRTEDPAAIRAAARAGAPDVIEIDDRRKAIRAAFSALGEGDILLIAGKGHESGQIVKGVTLPFDDAQVCHEIARELGGEAC